MFTLTVAILVCLAIAGQVQSYPHHKAEMQTFETALIMRLLHDSMAHTQGMTFTVGQCEILQTKPWI